MKIRCIQHIVYASISGLLVSPLVTNKKTISQLVWPFIIWQLDYFCTNFNAWVSMEKLVLENCLSWWLTNPCKPCGLVPLSNTQIFHILEHLNFCLLSHFGKSPPFSHLALIFLLPRHMASPFLSLQSGKVLIFSAVTPAKHLEAWHFKRPA